MNAKYLLLLTSVAVGTAGGIAYAQPYPPPGPPPDQGAYGDQGAYPDQGPDGQGYYGDQDYYNQNDQGAPDQGYQDPGYDQDYAPGQPVSVEFFYRQLSPYGHWVERPSYGWVWYPSHARGGWRPYTDGRWVMTDYGWTWVAQEPYGWATYHYGRWALDDQYGWVWVPGTQWGPAWVAWQQGSGYIGWAPLPPSVQFRAGIGLDFGGINLSVSLGPSAYCFVPERQFLAPSIRTYIAPEARNVTIIRNTTNITSYRMVNNRIVNQSVPVQRIEQVTGQRVQRLRVADAPNPAQGRTARVQNGQVTIFRPRVNTVRPVETPQQAIQQRPARGPRIARAPQPGAVQQPAPQVNVQGTPRMRRPITTEEVQRRQEVDHQALARQQADEQRRLSEVQRQDQQSRPQGASAQQIEQQHQAEARALQQQQQRDKQQLEARHQREQQLASQAQQGRRAQPQPPQQQEQKKGDNSRGNDNNRGNGRNKERQQQPPPPPPSR